MCFTTSTLILRKAYSVSRLYDWLKRSHMASKNPCAKRVTPETAYEVWQSYNGSFTYFVLKKYQFPEKEAQNPNAIWYCMVQSPITPKGEYSDVYVYSVKQGTAQIDNPLHRSLCVKGTSLHVLDEIGLAKYPVTELVLRDERLWQYLKLSIPPKHCEKVKRILEEHEITIVCIDAPDFVDLCLDDVQTTGGHDIEA